MYITVETPQHLFIPLAYNRLLKRKKQGASVHGAGIESEIHRIAHEFPFKHLTIPKVYEVIDTHSYVMDRVFNLEEIPECIPNHTLSPEICNELIDFANYMIREGYFLYKFTVLLTKSKPQLFDFSMCGIIDKGIVRFPNKDNSGHYDTLVSERRLFHYVVGYKGTLTEKSESDAQSEVNAGVSCI